MVVYTRVSCLAEFLKTRVFATNNKNVLRFALFFTFYFFFISDTAAPFRISDYRKIRKLLRSTKLSISPGTLWKLCPGIYTYIYARYIFSDGKAVKKENWRMVNGMGGRGCSWNSKQPIWRHKNSHLTRRARAGDKRRDGGMLRRAATSRRRLLLQPLCCYVYIYTRIMHKGTRGIQRWQTNASREIYIQSTIVGVIYIYTHITYISYSFLTL